MNSTVKIVAPVVEHAIDERNPVRSDQVQEPLLYIIQPKSPTSFFHKHNPGLQKSVASETSWKKSSCLCRFPAGANKEFTHSHDCCVHGRRDGVNWLVKQRA